MSILACAKLPGNCCKQTLPGAQSIEDRNATDAGYITKKCVECHKQRHLSDI